MLRRARAADSQFDSMSLPVRKFRMTLRGDDTTILEHDPEKWAPVFPRDKREAFARRSCSNKKIERSRVGGPHPRVSAIALIAGRAASWPRLEGWTAGLMVRDGASAPPHHEKT